uniref:Uncharacterized protein n=1 Tax=Heterorhabditis bacteriophora TaxID=37862 RepID=A0A1I7W8K2_HETBA
MIILNIVKTRIREAFVASQVDNNIWLMSHYFIQKMDL